MSIKKENINAFFSTITYCVKLSWRASRFYALVRLAGRIASPVCGILSAFAAKYVLNLLAGSWNPKIERAVALNIVLGCILVITIATAVIQRVVRYCESIHSELISQQISISVMEKALNADIEFFDNPNYYDKLTAASRDSYAMTNILWNAMECISSFITFIGAFSVFCGQNVLYGIIILTVAFPAAIAGMRYTKTLYNLSVEQINGERQKNYFNSLSTSRQYAQDIRLFNLAPYLKQRYMNIWSMLFGEKRKLMRRRSIVTGILELLPELATIGITIDLCYCILAGNATIGDYSLYTGLAAQLTSSVYTLSYSAMQIYDNKLRVANIRLLDTFKNRVCGGKQKLDKVKTIEFCNVSFTYPGGKNNALRNISFSVGDKEKVALVGLNGSGKSTIIKLLLRFYDADEGTIKINGVDIREFELNSLRKQFSVYFQEMQNYSFTIRENIQIADLEQTQNDEDICNALSGSDAANLVLRLPNGLDTYLTRTFHENGVELSGGQNQKIALARTFYRHSSALILDEPSSSLDPEAEHRVFTRLKQLCSGKTTLFTSHRLSNVSLADRIVVIENGEIVEQGTQGELLKRQSRYAELFRYQQEKFKETVC